MTPSPRLRSIYEVMAASLTEPDAPERRGELGRGWLEDRGLHPADLEALAAVDDRSFFAYRHLLRNNLREAIDNQLSRTRALLGERLDADIDAYFSSGLPTSRYLRDVAFELVDFATPRWRSAQDVPPFAAELALFELRSFESSVAVRPAASAARAVPKLELAAPVVLDESVKVTRYAYPVHELADGARELEARPTALLVYRDRDFELRFLELSPLAASIVERLLAGAALGEAITASCAAASTPISPELLGEIAQLLSDYAERGIVLGSPADPTFEPTDEPASE
ncbi:MAG: putative DNA-binding domain-containing protein [Polyangiaceae bacterium]|nr:putative DNA-binding domain-containing protein [Polyangiaceae bacterium]MBK8937078.1 putative DNA-binding domain-containing protein [Polyangiaceae bacterium]